MSIGEKQAAAREQLAEPPMPCPSDCGTTVMPAELLRHVAERCPGPRPPGQAAKWIGWREAIAQGVPPRTLANWANDGRVRFRGGRQDRQYLLRDLAFNLARRRVGRRR